MRRVVQSGIRWKTEKESRCEVGQRRDYKVASREPVPLVDLTWWSVTSTQKSLRQNSSCRFSLFSRSIFVQTYCAVDIAPYCLRLRRTQDVNSGASARMHSIEQCASHIGEGLSQYLQIEPRCSWIYSLIIVSLARATRSSS